MDSSDGPLESVMIRCPSGHSFNAPVEFLTWEKGESRGAEKPSARRQGRDTLTPARMYTILADPEPDGSYFVTVPALPGCFTVGRTLEECRERAAEAIEVHIASLQAQGEPVPEEGQAPRLLAVTVAA
jgi:antitoxin HicB